MKDIVSSAAFKDIIPTRAGIRGCVIAKKNILANTAIKYVVP